MESAVRQVGTFTVSAKCMLKKKHLGHTLLFEPFARHAYQDNVNLSHSLIPENRKENSGHLFSDAAIYLEFQQRKYVILSLSCHMEVNFAPIQIKMGGTLGLRHVPNGINMIWLCFIYMFNLHVCV